MSLPSDEDPDERLRHFQGCYSALMMGCATSNDKVTAPAMEVYWLVLQDLPMAAIEAATQELLKTSHWFPSTAEFHELATTLAMAQAEAAPLKALPAAPLSEEEQRWARDDLTRWTADLRRQQTPMAMAIAGFLERRPTPTTAAPSYECASCQDTSWRPVMEDDVPKVTRCACVETNSVIQRRRAMNYRFKRGDR
jgi:hypothetical protein